MVMSVRPAAAQIGQTSELEVAARYNLAGAYQVLVEGLGVTGEVVPAEESSKPDEKRPVGSIKIRLSVLSDALPGVRDLRIATPQGVSTVGQVVLVREAVVVDAGDNNKPESAQKIAVPCTLAGGIEKAEDIDCYAFTAQEGQSLVCHVQGGRIEDRIHDLQTHLDPVLTLRTSSGAVVSMADNTFAADPVLAHRFERSGDYVLEIRDVRYQGNADWQYAIEVSDQPWARSAFPPAVPPGSTMNLVLTGWNLPDSAVANWTAPGESENSTRWFSLTLGERQLNPVPMVICPLPLVTEPDPQPVQATGGLAEDPPLSVPFGWNGRLEAEADSDRVWFEAKKGDRFDLEVLARRLQSPVDPVLRIVNDQGGLVVENDDLSTGRHTHPDSRIEGWAAPGDGRFAAEVRDLHGRGGSDFLYFLRVERSQPGFALETDTDKTLLMPGTSGVVFVRAYRKNGFAGEITLAIDGLPQGVTASAGRILADGKDGCIILTAAPDAPVGVGQVSITGEGKWMADDGTEQTLSAKARTLQEVYLPGGGRGHFPVAMNTVSVSQPADVAAVRLSSHQLTLKPGESQRIDVTIERSGGYEKNITLDVQFRHLGSVYGDSLPPGVTLDESQSKTLLTGKETAGYLTFKAAADAKPVDAQQVSVMANVSVNFVMKMTYSSEPLWVTVTPP
jgi:hypothetical protein